MFLLIPVRVPNDLNVFDLFDHNESAESVYTQCSLVQVTPDYVIPVPMGNKVRSNGNKTPQNHYVRRHSWQQVA